MPATSTLPRNIVLAFLSGLTLLYLLGFFTSSTMDSLPSPFTIEIDGKPIAKLAADADDHTQARLGDDAAVFSLKDKRLQCGDWIVGRDLTENRSFLPKKVAWYKAGKENEERVQPVTARKEGEEYQLVFTSTFIMLDCVPAYTNSCADGKLMVEDGVVLVDLLGGGLRCFHFLCSDIYLQYTENQSEVKIILQ
jgi:hypothetical protein